MKGILKAKQKRRNDSLDILKPEHAPPGLLVHAYVNAGPTGSLDEVAIPQVGQQLNKNHDSKKSIIVNFILIFIYYLCPMSI